MRWWTCSTARRSCARSRSRRAQVTGAPSPAHLPWLTTAHRPLMLPEWSVHPSSPVSLSCVCFPGTCMHGSLALCEKAITNMCVLYLRWLSLIQIVLTTVDYSVRTVTCWWLNAPTIWFAHLRQIATKLQRSDLTSLYCSAFVPVLQLILCQRYLSGVGLSFSATFCSLAPCDKQLLAQWTVIASSRFYCSFMTVGLWFCCTCAHGLTGSL